MEKTRDSLLDVLRTLFKWKRPILIATVVAALGTALLSVLSLDDYFKASTLFYAASPDLARPEMFFGNNSSKPDFFGTERDVDRLLSISESGELIDYMITEFDLYRHYDIDSTHPKAGFFVRQEFFDLYKVLKNELGAIEISVEDKDPALAADMANAARDKTDQIARTLLRNSQEKLINNYEQTIRQQGEYLNQISDTLRDLRENYRIYNTASQSETLSQLMASAENQLIGERAKLEVLKNAGNRYRDSVVLIQTRISAATEQFDSLKSRLHIFNRGMTQIEVLERELREAALELSETKELYKQLLSARSSEVSAIHLVEAAQKPIIKSRPKRSIIVIGATFLAFVLSCLAVLLFDTYRDVDWKKMVSGKPDA